MTRRPSNAFRALARVLILCLGSSWPAGPALAFPADTPVTSEATPAARTLLNFFASTFGHKTLAGQHDGWRLTNGLSEELNYITNTTGKLPALLEMDVSDYTRPDHDRDHRLMQHALDWAQNRHGLVALCWHWRAPLQEPSFYTKETSFDATRAATPGTPEYAAVERDFDAVAGELEILRDAGVPVLWRPLHEANGRWFWWGNGGPEPFKQLWVRMFDDFTRKHHLNNLIWVFSPGAETDLAAWYPGDAFVDIVGLDHYPMDGNHNSAKDIFDELTRLTRGRKLIALGENGPIPDPALMTRDQAGWLFFSTWTGSILYDQTTPAQLRDYYNNSRVLTLTDLPDLHAFTPPPPGPAARLTFLGAPGDVAIGGRWRMPVSVAVQDQNGWTLRDQTWSVTLHAATPNGTPLPGTWTATTVNGIATFTNASIGTALPVCRWVAAADHLPDGVSADFAVGPGHGLKFETWSRCPDFSVPPDHVDWLPALETPVQLATNYSARVRGWLIAPASGAYRFSVANTGRSELRLGTNAAQAGIIATVSWDTPYRKWPHINEADSAAVSLEAGHKYYFELRQWQPRGSTQLHVRWQLPDGTEERPLPAYRFQSYD